MGGAGLLVSADAFGPTQAWSQRNGGVTTETSCGETRQPHTTVVQVLGPHHGPLLDGSSGAVEVLLNAYAHGAL